MRAKKVSDEKIITALLDTGTIKGTAAAVNLSERAIYDRMNAGEFQELYKAAKADIIRAAVVNINKHLQAAIDTAADIMNDPQNNAAIRLQAAQTIINTAAKFAQRLKDDENSVAIQQQDNRFNFSGIL